MRRQPGRLVFIDETSIKTNMTPLRGRSLKGERIMTDAPFGKWRTQTFIAGLRCHELVAPWIVEGAMDGPTFDSYVRTQLAPCLRRGDVVIPATNFVRADKFKRPQKSTCGTGTGRARRLVPVPAEILARSKSDRAGLRQAQNALAKGKGTDLWRAVGDICNLFEPQECWNYLKNAGYAAD
jgi:hypothetical protein